MPQIKQETNRISCRQTSIGREVYFNGYDTGLGTQDRGIIWSQWGTTKGRTWTRTPNYVNLKKAGQLPDNPLNFEQTVHKTSPFVTIRTGSNTTGGNWDIKFYFYQDIQSSAPLMPVKQRTDLDINLLTARASLDAISKMKSNQFNAPVFIAEAHKTSEMVLKRAKQLATVYLNLKKGRLGDAFSAMHPDFDLSESKKRRYQRKFDHDYKKSPSKAASNAWLEFQYGWIPFMLETRAAVNTLMDVVEDPRKRVVRSVGRAQGMLETSSHGTVMVSPHVNGDITEKQKCSVRVKWKAVPTSQDLPGRFGLTNPLEVAWELVPLSFVADWFLPIGDYLSALDAPMRFQHAGGVTGIRQDLSGSVRYTDGPSFQGVSGHAEYERILVSVNPLRSIPIPSFPDLIVKPNGLSRPRIASAVALLRQAFR